jgi:hypothetical protein
MQVKTREEHDARGSDDFFGRANVLDDIATLCLCDAWRLGKDHGEPSWMNLELGVIPCLEEDLFIGPLMFHGGLGVYIDARVEGLGFEESNPRMDM